MYLVTPQACPILPSRLSGSLLDNVKLAPLEGTSMPNAASYMAVSHNLSQSPLLLHEANSQAILYSHATVQPVCYLLGRRRTLELLSYADSACGLLPAMMGVCNHITERRA